MFSKIIALATAGIAAAHSGPAEYDKADATATFANKECALQADKWDSAVGTGDEKWWGTAPAQFKDENVALDNTGDACDLVFTTKSDAGWNPMGDAAEDQCDCGISFGDHSSGLRVSKAKFKYGYFEATVTAATGTGADVAAARTSFWLQGNGGEINIADVYSNPDEDQTATNDFHCWTANDGSDTTSSEAFLDGIKQVGSNTYGVLWTAESIKFFVNGELHRTLTKEEVACIDTEMHLILSTETNFANGDEVDTAEAQGYTLTSRFSGVGRWEKGTTTGPSAEDVAMCENIGTNKKKCKNPSNSEKCKWNNSAGKCEAKAADTTTPTEPTEPTGPSAEDVAMCKKLNKKSKCDKNSKCKWSAGNCKAKPADTTTPTGPSAEDVAMCKKLKNKNKCNKNSKCKWSAGNCKAKPADTTTPTEPTEPTEPTDPTGPSAEDVAMCKKLNNKNKCNKNTKCKWSAGNCKAKPADTTTTTDTPCKNHTTKGKCVGSQSPKCKWNKNREVCLDARRTRRRVELRGREVEV